MRQLLAKSSLPIVIITGDLWSAWPKDGLCLDCLWIGACDGDYICGSGSRAHRGWCRDGDIRPPPPPLHTDAALPKTEELVPI